MNKWKFSLFAVAFAGSEEFPKLLNFAHHEINNAYKKQKNNTKGKENMLFDKTSEISIRKTKNFRKCIYHSSMFIKLNTKLKTIITTDFNFLNSSNIRVHKSSLKITQFTFYKKQDSPLHNTKRLLRIRCVHKRVLNTAETPNVNYAVQGCKGCS